MKVLNSYEKIIKTIAFFLAFVYVKCNRVARSCSDIGDQAESCAQLFLLKRNDMNSVVDSGKVIL